jgi:phosphoglycolate phosphatase
VLSRVVTRRQLIVFDLDGTLIDSRRDIADAANALLVSCGAPPIAETDIGRMVGDGAARLVARAFTASGIERPPDALERYLAFYDERLVNHTRPYPGIPAALDVLQRACTLAVLTNKPLASTRRILDALDLARYFSSALVLGGDGPFARKPDPAALRHLMGCAGADAATTVMVGDSRIDWQTARAAPARLCLARYGFGFDSMPLHEIAADDRVIDEPGELLSL